MFILAGCFWRGEPFVITSKPAAISHFRCRNWRKKTWIMFRKYEANRKWHSTRPSCTARSAKKHQLIFYVLMMDLHIYSCSFYILTHRNYLPSAIWKSIVRGRTLFSSLLKKLWLFLICWIKTFIFPCHVFKGQVFRENCCYIGNQDWGTDFRTFKSFHQLQI